MHELVHRHQLDRGNAESLQVLDHGRMRQAREGAAFLHGHLGVEHGHAFDMGFVDERVAVRDPQGAVALPVEERADHHRPHRRAGRIACIQRERIARIVGEHGLPPSDVPAGRFRVRVQQQLGRVTSHPVGRVIGPLHPVTVRLSREHMGQVAVPDERVHSLQGNPLLGPSLIEQAQIHRTGRFAEDGEVGAAAVIRRPQGIGTAAQTSMNPSDTEKAPPTTPDSPGAPCPDPSNAKI